MISYMWNIKMSKTHRNSEKNGGFLGQGVRGNREMLVKDYRLPDKREISFGGLMYSMMTTVHNTVSYT